MTKSILITGASSGIGKATAFYFAEKGWQVFAAMRNVGDFENKGLPNLVALKMDVTDEEDIKICIGEVLKRTNRLDALVNNAGYGGFGAFELSAPEQRRAMFDVNVFGAMNVTQAVLPHFRQNRSGVIINVSSIGGLMTYPLYSVYHGTKWAIEGFSESLHYELKHFGIKVKLIEPGATKSDFQNRSQVQFKNAEISAYDDYMNKLFPKVSEAFSRAISAERVAAEIYKSATDGTNKLRYPVGNQQSLLLLRLRKLLPVSLFVKLISKNVEN